MTGRSVVNSASNSGSLIPCGCSADGWSRIRSTTLTTRTRRSRQVLAEDADRGEHLQGGHVAGAGQHHVGLGAVAVAAGPFPDPRAPGAVQDRGVHVQPVLGRLLARDDHVDVVPAAQAVVGDRQQRVRVRRQVDPDHLGLLVDHMVNEARVLVREAVMVLARSMVPCCQSAYLVPFGSF